MAFFTILSGATVYAPDCLGRKDVLVAGDRIISIEDDLSLHGDVEVERISLEGMNLTPGFVDCHVHITGGGGEAGPASRLPEISVDKILKAGVTTVLGLLGTDDITRSLEGVLAKAQGLECEGITARVLCGGYIFPDLPTITGSVRKDVALIPHIIGVGELALADHRGGHAPFGDFAKVVADARVGGLVGGKAGLVVTHMGAEEEQMDKLFQLQRETDIPITQVLPTHMNRTRPLFEQGVEYARLGGNLDVTARPDPDSSVVSLAEAVSLFQEQQLDLKQLTMSSDGNGSLPKFDANGQLCGFTMAEITSLTNEFAHLVTRCDIRPEVALPLFCTNPAARMGLQGEKGTLAPGGCADMVVFDHEWKVDMVFARGRLRVEHGHVTQGGFMS